MVCVCVCVFSTGVKFRVSDWLQQLTHSHFYRRHAEPLTGHSDSWKMSSSLNSTGNRGGKFPRLTPTPPMWEGIPWWASEWLASAEAISKSFPTCTTTGIPWPPSSDSVSAHYLEAPNLPETPADTWQKQESAKTRKMLARMQYYDHFNPKRELNWWIQSSAEVLR